MKKSLVVLAVLAAAGTVSAQSSVTVFGVADIAYTRVESDAATGNVSRNSVTSGANRTSRIGFRGIEDLGGGLKAGFWLEAGVSLDNGSSASTPIFTGNQIAGSPVAGGTNVAANPAVGGGGQGLTFNRRATVSLIGNFGEVRFGRDSVAALLAQESFDPFDANGVGGIRQIVYGNSNASIPGPARGPTVRASNMVEYFLPSDLGGFNGTIAYAFGENASNATTTSGVAPAAVFSSSAKNNGEIVTGRIGYSQGPFDIKLAATQYKFRLPTGISNDFTEYTLGGSYDFQVVKIFLAYHSNEVDNFEAKTDSVILSGTAPLGPGLLRAVYVNASQKGFTGNASGNDGNQFSIGYIYNLSKRTSVYATYAVADNKGTSTRYVVGSGGPATPRAGGKSTGFDLGITHAF